MLNNSDGDRMDWWEKFSERATIDDIDRYRKKSIFYFISFFGAAVILYFSAKSYQSYDVTLSVILLFGAVLISVNAVLAILLKKDDIHYYLAVACVLIMLLGVVYTGGYKNTALYWLYPMPLIFFVLLGVKIGGVINFLFYIALLILLHPSVSIPASYEPAETSRFFTSFALMNFISFIADYFRHQSHSKLAKISHAKLRQAYTDSLTKLPNRRFLSSVLTDRFMKNSEYFPLSLVNIDIDHFKAINDTYGHQVGDDVLKSFAALCTENIRKDDVIVRTGGEEFLLFFVNTTKDQGATLAEKLRELIAGNSIHMGGQEFTVTASFGVAECHRFEALDHALKIADKRMYLAKQWGRNQVVSQEPE
ncbi:GGDEF domain-containing protein [Thalassotalea sp. PP2-459]|uniref:GGDEF domain-containing protein n=1 Tax=Thalassotalea sp. PP2-459 TaxID=1742724 RepID=UPI0009F90AA8|nr:GGDEF domain-containing protein [Thalassotalea sp. PP2-459]